MSGSTVLRGLVRGLVDYAGLFPPASLSMRAVVSNYAQYLGGDDAWALGRLVVPIARLAEFETEVRTLGVDAISTPWRLSGLATSPADLATITAFNTRWTGRLVVDAIESRATSPGDVDALGALQSPGVELFVELAPGPSLLACLTAVRRIGAAAKLRAGGVVADAFPSADDVVAFLRACREAGVPFKATAGLHHPIRGTYPLTYEPDSPRGVMHGYLNVLLASSLVAAGGSDADARRILLADSLDDFTVGRDRVTWAGVEVPFDPSLARPMLRGVGSCSFREPVDELAALVAA
ncbi:MAG: hypothetical protein IT361_16590 [Gemmatimonadaceae bacterium]|nr:hypothetical protein [Gemmatimonadaceae bacterium]